MCSADNSITDHRSRLCLHFLDKVVFILENVWLSIASILNLSKIRSWTKEIFAVHASYLHALHACAWI